MPQFKVDLTQAKEFKTPLPGRYVATVRNVKLGESRTGNPKLTMQLVITDVADGSEENTEFIGQSAFDHLVLNGEGAWKTREALQALLGYAPGPDDELSTDDLLETTAIIVVTNEVWTEEAGGDGRISAKIAHYEASGL